MIIFYKLQNYIALRGWFGDPFNYVNYEDGLIYKLNKNELDVLKKCDGKTDVLEDQTIRSMLKEGIIYKCNKNDHIKGWQKYKFCYNNCFSTAYWAITGKCNYNCKHCFMASSDKKIYSEFTLEECIKFLDSCDKCGIYSIVLTGGEPFLHPNFFEIINECKKRNIKIKEILTNGSFITESVLDKFREAQIDPIIKVSFDGIGYHDWMRGTMGAESKTIKSIRLLKEREFKVYVQMCIQKNNIDSIYPTTKFFDSLGVDKMRILRTCESPRWEKYVNMGLSIKEYYDLSLDFVNKYISSMHSMPIEIFKFISIYPKYKKYSCTPILKNGNKYNQIPICSEMRFCVNVSSSGEIVPCNRLMGYYNKYGIKFGNVKKENMQQLLLDSEYFRESSRTVEDLLKINEKCRECKYISMCYVGCRAGAAIFSGNISGADISKCVYFNEGYQDKTAKVLSNYNYIEV